KACPRPGLPGPPAPGPRRRPTVVACHPSFPLKNRTDRSSCQKGFSTDQGGCPTSPGFCLTAARRALYLGAGTAAPPRLSHQGRSAMRCLILAAAGLALAPPARAADDVPPPKGDTIVSPDAKWELLFTRSAPIKGGLTEGPAAAPDGSIYFSDIPFG